MPDRVERLREVYDRWAVGDWRAGVELFTPDVDFRTFDADSDEIVCRGRAEVSAWMRSFLPQWDAFRKELIEAEVRGDKVLVSSRQSARGRTSGMPIEMPAWDVWTFEGDRVTGLHVTRHETVARAAFDGD